MVYQDRHGWQRKLKELLGINPVIEQSTFIQSSSDSENSSNTPDKNKIIFQLSIPFEVFLTIKPIRVPYKDKHRGLKYYDILKPFIY
jgi:hypothetical protein